MVCARGTSSATALGLLLMSAAYVFDARSRSRIAPMRSPLAA